MSRTFTVSKVAPATQRRPALDRTRVLPDLVRRRVEQMWASDARLVSCTNVHPLVQMAHDAFYEHRPIALSPDAIWFCIAQDSSAIKLTFGKPRISDRTGSRIVGPRPR